MCVYMLKFKFNLILILRVEKFVLIPQVNEIFWRFMFLVIVLSVFQSYMFFNFFLDFSILKKVFVGLSSFSEF